MAITKVKHAKEDTFDRVMREDREKKAKEKVAEKNKKIADAEEEKRLYNIVLPHLDKLEKQLLERQSDDFWTFPDRSGFKKIKNNTFKKIEILLKKDIPKYANRKICNIEITFTHNEPITHIFRKNGILLIVDITIYHIDKKGDILGKIRPYGITFNWKINDFATTKLTFKFLETIMHPVTNNIIGGVGFSGLPLQIVISNLHKKKIDISNVLIPLAGCIGNTEKPIIS